MEENALVFIEEKLEELEPSVHQGILILFLVREKISLLQLSELVDSHECVDILTQLPITETSGLDIGILPAAVPLLQEKFKWSEKVKEAKRVAAYFEHKSINAGTMGDLWLLAGRRDLACKAYMAAFEHYQGEQSMVSAIEVGEKVLKVDVISSDAEIKLLQNLVECYECCGHLHDVIQARKKLLEKEKIQADSDTHAQILRALAIDYGKQGSWMHYKRYREKAALIFQEIAKYEEAATEFLALTNRGIDEINLVVGLQCAEKALLDAERSGKIELICKAKSIKAYIIAMTGQSEVAHELAEEALELALRNNLLEAAAYAYRKLAGTYEYASDFEQAKRVYMQAAGFCEAQHMDAQSQLCYSCLSWILFRMGDWKKAIEVSYGLINDPTVNNPSKATAHCVIAYIRALKGEIRSAEKHAQEGILLSQKEHFLLIYHMLHLPLAKVFELKGNLEKAREWYTKVIDEWHLTQEKHDVLLSLMDVAVFFASQNNDKGIKKCLEIGSFICKETGNDEALGCMAFILGQHALLNKEPEVALQHLTDARKYLEPLHIPYQVMLIEFEIGRSLLAVNQSEEAKSNWQDLMVQTKKLGLLPLTAKITAMINNIPETAVPREAILTRRQLDVIRLLAKGLSNKEIANELFLSTRTVDMHMRHLFDRLSCNSRWEAVDRARSFGII